MELLVIWVGISVVVTFVAWRKGRNVIHWLIYALLLCPIAAVHVAFARSTPGRLDGDRLKCPYCAAQIRIETRTCRHCNQSLPEDWSATWRAG